jgi:tRNA dimethylallyltransferase
MLEGKIPTAELLDRGIFATRQFAKRQLTWLRATPELVSLDSLDSSTPDQALRTIDGFLR